MVSVARLAGAEAVGSSEHPRLDSRMKAILRTQTLTQAHAVRIALEARGIDAVLRGEHSIGTIGGGVSVWVVRDDDVERARFVLAELPGSPAP